MTETPLLAVLNHLLAQADWARQRLVPYCGRGALFVMPPLRLAFAVAADGRFEPTTAEPDVTVSLPAEGPFLALQGIDRLMAEAHVTGNAEFATELSFVLKNLRWDAEEDLSGLLGALFGREAGDIAAHRIAAGARDLLAWQKDAMRRLADNVFEYATEEQGLLATRREFDELRRQNQSLADSLTTLERRLVRLHNDSAKGSRR